MISLPALSLLLSLAAPAHALPAALSGAWRLTTPAEQIRAQQEAALATALASLSYLLQPIADRLIRPTFFFCTTYQITASGDAFSSSCDGRPPIALSVGGSTPVTYDGQPFTASLSGDDREARLSLGGGNGTRTTRYRPGGPGLQVEVTISSDRLTVPLRWAMEYRKE